MSAIIPVCYYDKMFWAYDVALSILLKHLIDAALPVATNRGELWLADAITSWRVSAVVGDSSFRIDESWLPGRLRLFVDLIDQACTTLTERDTISADEITAWHILDDHCLYTRGAKVVFTVPVVELGRAIIALVSDSLPDAPVGTVWFFGTSEGRRTIRMG